ncbi:MAG: phosphoglucomutase/phosphomannomutase family protein [Dehalococcoidia bacterium]|nr:phosphoglucomutase/phosphomannomutase family protein [Dehalococcoidia bacterium]
MNDNPIRFGTDGWRALIADTFTFENVRACAKAAAQHFRDTQGTDAPLVVGWDTRFLSQEFARQAAGVLAEEGFKVLLASRAAPTPAASQQLVERGAAGGLVITSSHNPYNWNGVKVKPHYGGSASPAVVADIEARLPAILAEGVPAPHPAPGTVEEFDPVPGYLKAIGERVDLQAIRDAGLRIAFDPMYGTGAGLLAELIGGGKTTVIETHAEPNPRFPGIRAPEPIDENLDALKRMVAEGSFDIGIATDGDSDRLGLVDERGEYVDQLRAFALLCYFFLEIRGERGAIVRSITTTAMADRLGAHYGVEVIETPVGFKHIAPVMMERDALIGGEESGGYGFRGHLPERDGLLAALYVLEAVAVTGKRPSELVEAMFAVTGAHYYKREDFAIDERARDEIVAKLDSAEPATVAGIAVTGKDRMDGWRFSTDAGWLLFRMSGTEPLLRIYTEVREERLVDAFISEGRTIAGVA